MLTTSDIENLRCQFTKKYRQEPNMLLVGKKEQAQLAEMSRPLAKYFKTAHLEIIQTGCAEMLEMGVV